MSFCLFGYFPISHRQSNSLISKSLSCGKKILSDAKVRLTIVGVTSQLPFSSFSSPLRNTSTVTLGSCCQRISSGSSSPPLIHSAGAKCRLQIWANATISPLEEWLVLHSALGDNHTHYAYLDTEVCLSRYQVHDGHRVQRGAVRPCSGSRGNLPMGGSYRRLLP